MRLFHFRKNGTEILEGYNTHSIILRRPTELVTFIISKGEDAEKFLVHKGNRIQRTPAIVTFSRTRPN